jgi:hypothetical protein
MRNPNCVQVNIKYLYKMSGVIEVSLHSEPWKICTSISGTSFHIHRCIFAEFSGLNCWSKAQRMFYVCGAEILEQVVFHICEVEGLTEVCPI